MGLLPMNEPLTLNSLDKRVTRLEDTRKSAEETMMLKISALIDKKMDARFGWLSRVWQGVFQAIVIAAVLYFFGLSTAG